MCLLLFNPESLVRINLIVLFDYLIRLSQNVHSFPIGWESCSLNTHLLMCPDAHMHTYTHVCVYACIHTFRMHECVYGAHGRGCDLVDHTSSHF